MGYTTEFSGRFNITPKIHDKHAQIFRRFVDDYNSIYGNNLKPPYPGSYCQWVLTDDNSGIEWDGGEKFYNYIEWLGYIIKNFFIPWGYKVDGKVNYQGLDIGDVGTITITNNVITAKSVNLDRIDEDDKKDPALENLLKKLDDADEEDRVTYKFDTYEEVRRFVFQDGKSNKYWEIHRQNLTLIIHYGKFNTKGVTIHKEMANMTDLTKEYDRAVKEKLNKGYIEEKQNDPVNEYGIRESEQQAFTAVNDIMVNKEHTLTTNQRSFISMYVDKWYEMINA